MTQFRKALFFLPLLFAYLLCDNTLKSFIEMSIGGLILWIPYWLAWWLSDGFSNVQLANLNNDFDEILFSTNSEVYVYTFGPQGLGYYDNGMLLSN